MKRREPPTRDELVREAQTAVRWRAQREGDSDSPALTEALEHVERVVDGLLSGGRR